MMQFLICTSNQNVKERDKYNRGVKVSTKVDVRSRKMNSMLSPQPFNLNVNINLSDASLMTML